MNMKQIRIDLPYDMKLQDFLEMLERYGAKLISWDSIGAAGGNPDVKLELPEDQVALLLKELEG